MLHSTAGGEEAAHLRHHVIVCADGVCVGRGGQQRLARALRGGGGAVRGTRQETAALLGRLCWCTEIRSDSGKT